MSTIDQTAGRTGLVLCPKTRTRFPGPELVGNAAAGIGRASAEYGADWQTGHLAEGPRHFVVVSPGSVRVGSIDLAGAQRTAARAGDRHVCDVDQLAGQIATDQALDALHAAGLTAVGAPDRSMPESCRRIYEWSAKSRANMVRRLLSLDYGPLLQRGELAMLTLTYPGACDWCTLSGQQATCRDWVSVVPDGKAFKSHLDKLRQRYRKRWGHALIGVWKMEFQRRGAPHWHMLMVPPSDSGFRSWLSKAWSDIVAHPDAIQRAKHLQAGTAIDYRDGLRMTDPQRVAVYFTKHGLLAGKEYQNTPPVEWIDSGVTIGRFWGVWGLRPAEAVAIVSAEEAEVVLRELRRWHAAGHRAVMLDQGQERSVLPLPVDVAHLRIPVRECLVWRSRRSIDPYTGELVQRWRRRKVRRRIKRLGHRGGFLGVNDGVAVAWMVQRLLERHSHRLVTIAAD